MKIQLQFPCSIKQVGDNVIEIERVQSGPFFANGAIDNLAPDLSLAAKDQLADDIIDFALGETIRRSITVITKIPNKPNIT